ncbi:MAG: class IV adenylate cyclase [Pirellulaceae bacterium]|jgi:adenylate cyclase class 2|nr:class IV adenylate cyclase [Pirellulaceae bacterium]MDP7017394.1 class IV adenylate cyclase [Pirellulaceae bacterium]
MQLEVEQKLAVANLSDVESALVEWGAEFSEPITQVDVYFRHPSRDFAATDEALRIRRIGERNRVTYKGPKLGELTKTRRELEFEIGAGASGYDQHEQLLLALGFSIVASVEKHRRHATLHWRGAEVELSLDAVPGVGEFYELEMIAEESEFEAVENKLLSLIEAIGLGRVERRSYLEMYLSRTTSTPDDGAG